MLNRILIVSLAMGMSFLIGAEHVTAGETGWSPRIIATGEFKQKIESTPIELRPNRPLHFYGNTVRRRHYRALRNASQQTASKSSRSDRKKRG